MPGLDLVDPALRPDGQVIAAVRSDIGNAGTDSIVTMPISGVATNSAATPVTQVTSPGTASVPDFSPDGEHIAFVSDRSGYLEIWTARRDGAKRVALRSIVS